MGVIVAIEGLPGSGKTTALKKIMKQLEKRGISAALTDVDSLPNARQLRRVADALPVNNIARSLIFWSLRVFQYETAAALAKDFQIVLMDRSWGTALAFDCYGNKIPRKMLEWLEANLPGTKPNATLFLRVPLNIARSRKKVNTLKDLNRAKRVESGYAILARERKWIMIDGTKSQDAVVQQCLKHIQRLLILDSSRVF